MVGQVPELIIHCADHYISDWKINIYRFYFIFDHVYAPVELPIRPAAVSANLIHSRRQIVFMMFLLLPEFSMFF